VIYDPEKRKVVGRNVNNVKPDPAVHGRTVVSSTVTFVKDKEGKVTKLIFTSGGKAYEGIKVK
jgi:hypothetical protein